MSTEVQRPHGPVTDSLWEQALAMRLANQEAGWDGSMAITLTADEFAKFEDELRACDFEVIGETRIFGVAIRSTDEASRLERVGSGAVRPRLVP